MKRLDFARSNNPTIIPEASKMALWPRVKYFSGM
jgi:hypothetical protein